MSDAGTNVIPVVWLIAAYDQLENALAQAGEFVGRTQDEQKLGLREHRKRLDLLLRRTFDQAEAITVLERLSGYSYRATCHVLRVEMEKREPDGEGRTEAYVVKIAPCKDLCKELIGRQTCERPANQRGRTLLNVRMGFCPHGAVAPKQPCPDASDDDQGALIYDDAYHTLRAGQVVSLEEAFFRCVRWGTPSPATIFAVLDQVFQELHNLCYERAPAVLPEGKDVLASLKDRLEKSRKRWRDPSSIPGESRVQARGLLHEKGAFLPFVDLLDFHARAFRQPNYQPELRFGRAHGDLHGRNIVVGLINGEARWPAVFDFEDMGVDNYVAWDFVKLETELKIRALRLVFPGPPERFVPETYQFECELNEETEARDRESSESWGDDCGAADDSRNSGDRDHQRSRLRTLLLGLRRRAKRYLHTLGPVRAYRWLHEYYFFLACYGVYTGRFENYRVKECLAAYLAGSCAATRYAWGVEKVYMSPADGKALAQERLDRTKLLHHFPAALPRDPPQPAATEDGQPASDHAMGPELRWDVRLEELKTFARSRTEEHIRNAVDGLSQLREKIPSSAEIVQELAFALLELANVTGETQFYHRAVEALSDFEQRQEGLYSRDLELLCRWGRLWKDCGDQALDKAQHSPSPQAPQDAEDGVGGEDVAPSRLRPAQWYGMSASYYRRAYDASKAYYPGINLATLKFLIAALEPPPPTGQRPSSGGRTYQDLALEIRANLEKQLADRTEQAREPKQPPPADGEPTGEPDDVHWQLASLGEACLLLEDNKAVEHYRRALTHENTDSHAREAIIKQAKRIMGQQAKGNAKKIHTQLRKLFKDFTGPAGDTPGRPSTGKPTAG